MATNMTGKLVLITGATNGIGKETALGLARLGARIVMVGRSAEKTQAVVDEIKAKTGNLQMEYLLADLSSMAEVRRLADEFKGRYDRLDVLINNAGAVFASRQETIDGYEMTFALNHLSYFLLTELLLDRLKACAPSRIVNVSSDAHTFGPMNFDDLMTKNNYSLGGFRAYGQSKLANVLFTYELARRLEGTGVTANVLHPGLVASGFGRNNGALMNLAMRIVQRFALTSERGASTSIYLASSPEVEGVSGKYFELSKAKASSKESYDVEAARKLWGISEELTGLRQPATI